MKLYRVGIMHLGKKAYLVTFDGIHLSYEVERALLFTFDRAVNAQNWITFCIPTTEAFVEEVQ